MNGGAVGPDVLPDEVEVAICEVLPPANEPLDCDCEEADTTEVSED